MDLDKLGEEAKKENILSILGKLCRVDGHLHENELVYLIHLGHHMNIEEEKVRQILIEPTQDLFIPTEEVDRMTIFYYMVLLIKMDGQILKEETNILHHFGLKLGFNHLMVSNMLDVIKLKKDEKLNPNDLLNQIKKYLN